MLVGLRWWWFIFSWIVLLGVVVSLFLVWLSRLCWKFIFWLSSLSC